MCTMPKTQFTDHNFTECLSCISLGMTPGRGLTPARSTPGPTPGRTPVRDKLSINAEEDMDLEAMSRLQQRDQKDQLRHGLSSLPRPKNDYEIVLPENTDGQGADIEETMEYVEDQSDLDLMKEAKLQALRKIC